MKHSRRRHVYYLFLTLPFIQLVHSISLSARRVQTTFSLLTNTTRCARTITHSRIATFRNINPAQPSKVFDAILWDSLLIDQTPCQTTLTNRVIQSTYFVPRDTSPPGVPPDAAQPFFLEGRDNSKRKCETFNTTLPATYLFTDDLPTFRDRFIRQGLLDPDLENDSVRGDIYMFVIPITEQADIVGRTCAYIEFEDVVMVTPTPQVVDMPACFPGDAVVNTPFGRMTMLDLRIGDLVTTPYGFESVVSFTHRSELPSTFISLKAGNVTIELSKDHLISVDGRMIPAGLIKPGDRLSGVSSELVVNEVKQVWKKGLYAPVTGSGVMYVHDVAVSCYTTAFGHVVSHALLGPVRAMNRVFWWDVCGFVDVLRSVLWR